MSSTYIVGNPLDTALALQALKAVNYSDQTIIQSVINYLLSTENSVGGWGFYQGDESNVYMTALVSMTLQQFQRTTSIATAINKAASYLIAHQNADGGFGTSDSTVYETAYAYLALIGVTTNATVLSNAINYLTSTQLTNGSWNDDPYSTALALRALATVKPNLSISSNDITFSNPTPTTGETITITANVKNTGTAQADNVLLHFYDGDPSGGGLLIGETTIASISSFGSSTATITYTIPTASSKTIFIKIDPLNTIDELDDTDNIASKNLTSSTLPDLSITSADITMFPPFPESRRDGCL
ncbi:MAG: CARDB domain-containing protein [Thermodesulfovibrionales bacterium]